MALQSADVQLLRCLNISSKKKGRKQPIKLQTEKRVNKSSSLQQHIWAVLLVTAAASLVIRKQMYKNPPANPFHSQGVCAGEDIHMSSHPCAGGSFMFPRSKGPAAYGCPAPRAPQPGPLQRAERRHSAGESGQNSRSIPRALLCSLAWFLAFVGFFY